MVNLDSRVIGYRFKRCWGQGVLQLPKAQKPIYKPAWWKNCFISDAGNWMWGEWGEWQTPVQRPTTPTLDKQKVRDFIDRNGGGRGGRLHVEKAQSFLTVVITLVISGLTSAILVVLGTVHLQFQGPFVPIS